MKTMIGGSLYNSYLSFVSTGVVCAKERRHVRKKIDMCDDRWKDWRMISFVIYIYSCLYHLGS